MEILHSTKSSSVCVVIELEFDNTDLLHDDIARRHNLADSLSVVRNVY